MERKPFSKTINFGSTIKVDIWLLLRKTEKGAYRSFTLTWNNGDQIIVEVEPDRKYITFLYEQKSYINNKKEIYNYQISLTKSHCHFGGYRYWFLCPISKNGTTCNRRVGTLYKGDDIFGCRHCLNLIYPSKNLGGFNKLINKVISYQDIEIMESKIKRKTYRGILTRKYNKFLIKKINNNNLCVSMVKMLNKSLDKKNNRL